MRFTKKKKKYFNYYNNKLNNKLNNKSVKNKKKIGGNKTLKKHFKKINCSPTNKKSINHFTCYDDNDLQELKKIWNARHPDALIKTNNSKEIWNKLKDYYSNICNKESCWINQMVKNPKLKNDLLNSFAPKSPDKWKKNPNEWLSSIDIIKVMNQYEKKYKNFDFLGPSPIDYDTHEISGKCVWEELCHFELENHIKKGFNKIGVIFNTDPHNKGGEHWISLFIDIENKYIYFFDSVGNKIPKRIMKFVNKVIQQGKKMNNSINFTFDQNYPVEHQKGNTECGMYSLFFIINMLEKKINGKYLKTHKLNDKFVEKFRKIYYNEELH